MKEYRKRFNKTVFTLKLRASAPSRALESYLLCLIGNPPLALLFWTKCRVLWCPASWFIDRSCFIIFLSKSNGWIILMMMILSAFVCTYM